MDGMSVDAELRMFTLAERDAALTRAKAAVAARKREPTGMESTLHLLAATLVAPGTDDLLLTGHDVETLMDFPADAWIQDAGIALGKMLEGSQDVGKDSAASPSAT